MVGVAYRVEGNKGEKKWDNCNSIINKYVKNLKKKKKPCMQGGAGKKYSES